ncbi:unnamed protein product [Prorocentrum cordatum]|uniref:Uncharacterized protein n=1 Tax=Prorocentrum cordatum TaxID=2364126 RepID=A0ABN9P6V5_9DINO|nr:unnamed protein product [Polarella glacialis]
MRARQIRGARGILLRNVGRISGAILRPLGGRRRVNAARAYPNRRASSVIPLLGQAEGGGKTASSSEVLTVVIPWLLRGCATLLDPATRDAMTRCTLPAGRLRRTTVPQREGTKKTQAKGLWRSGCRAHVPGEGADWPCIWILAQRPVFAQGVLQDLLHGAVRLHVEGVNDALQPLKHVLGVAARVRAGAQAGVPVQAHEAVAQAAALQLRERPPERSCPRVRQAPLHLPGPGDGRVVRRVVFAQPCGLLSTTGRGPDGVPAGSAESMAGQPHVNPSSSAHRSGPAGADHRWCSIL